MTPQSIGSLPTGPFTITEAESGGPHRKTLSRMTAAGFLRRMLHGVYVASYVVETVELRCQALRLVVPLRRVRLRSDGCVAARSGRSPGSR